MMKRICSVLLAAALALSFAGCGGEKREAAQTVVENAIASVKNTDFAAMQGYWGEEAFGDAEEALQVDGDDAALMKAMTSRLSYTVKESKEDEKAGTATVTVEFTNTDMSHVMGEFIQQAFSDAMSYAFLPEEEQPSEEELNDKYMDILTGLMASEDSETVTNTVDIGLTLADNAWKLTPSEEAVDAMLGGLLSFADSMTDAFGAAS